MARFKMFIGNSPAALETEANNWLVEARSAKNIRIAASQAVTGSGAFRDSYYYTLWILYDE